MGDGRRRTRVPPVVNGTAPHVVGMRRAATDAVGKRARPQYVALSRQNTPESPDAHPDAHPGQRQGSKAIPVKQIAQKLSKQPEGLAEEYKGRLELLPPQICPLALGVNGLSRLLVSWGRLTGNDYLIPLSQGLAAVATWLLAAYCLKACLAPSAAWKDASEPATLSALCAAPALAQALAVKFYSEDGALSLLGTQVIVLACYATGVTGTVRFIFLNYRKKLAPDPSWFPGVSLWGMTNITTQTVGPFWLQALMPAQFCLLMLLYVPLKLVVAYRILLSKDRNSITPNAGMNTLMAPASFFTIMHLSTGKPYGDLLGALLFADSTLFLVITIWMLYCRRALWSKAFHVSYVSFTFPVASTATAAVLAADRLSYFEGSIAFWARSWATLLTVIATPIILLVLLRYLWFLHRLFHYGETRKTR